MITYKFYPEHHKIIVKTERRLNKTKLEELKHYSLDQWKNIKLKDIEAFELNY